LRGAEEVVSRTFVGANRRGGVGAQNTTLHQVHISDAIGFGSKSARSIPRHDIVDPIIQVLVNDTVQRGLDSIVVRNPVIEIAGINMPGERDLLGVIETADALGFGLGLLRAGKIIDARMAIIAMTTRSSIRVNPREGEG